MIQQLDGRHFTYDPKSRTLHGTTRELGPIKDGENIQIQGKTANVVFVYVGGDEDYDFVAAECMSFIYRSSCGQWMARIKLV